MICNARRLIKRCPFTTCPHRDRAVSVRTGPAGAGTGGSQAKQGRERLQPFYKTVSIHDPHFLDVLRARNRQFFAADLRVQILVLGGLARRWDWRRLATAKWCLVGGGLFSRAMAAVRYGVLKNAFASQARGGFINRELFEVKKRLRRINFMKRRFGIRIFLKKGILEGYWSEKGAELTVQNAHNGTFACGSASSS